MDGGPKAGEEVAASGNSFLAGDDLGSLEMLFAALPCVGTAVTTTRTHTDPGHGWFCGGENAIRGSVPIDAVTATEAGFLE